MTQNHHSPKPSGHTECLHLSQQSHAEAWTHHVIVLRGRAFSLFEIKRLEPPRKGLMPLKEEDEFPLSALPGCQEEVVQTKKREPRTERCSTLTPGTGE